MPLTGSRAPSSRVLNGSHVSVMSLCRRLLRRDLRLLGFSVLCLWVRPLGQVTLYEN